METMIEFKVGDDKYTFVNRTESTSQGFAHVSQMFKNGSYKGHARIHYLNRTWESYQYQSVMRRNVSRLMDNRALDLLEEFKTRNNYSRMTEKRRKEYEAEYEADSVLKELEYLAKCVERGREAWNSIA